MWPNCQLGKVIANTSIKKTLLKISTFHNSQFFTLSVAALFVPSINVVIIIFHVLNQLFCLEICFRWSSLTVTSVLIPFVKITNPHPFITEAYIWQKHTKSLRYYDVPGKHENYQFHFHYVHCRKKKCFSLWICHTSIKNVLFTLIFVLRINSWLSTNYISNCGRGGQQFILSITFRMNLKKCL